MSASLEKRLDAIEEMVGNAIEAFVVADCTTGSDGPIVMTDAGKDYFQQENESREAFRARALAEAKARPWTGVKVVVLHTGRVPTLASPH